MPGMRYFVPALALASNAFAQCSTKGTLTITNTAQATQLASCTTFTGNIEVDKTASGDISIDGPREIVGDLTVSDAKHLTGLSGSGLQTIKGEFKLESLVGITSLSFPMLTEADSIFFQSLGPGLSAPDFSTGITTINDLFIDQCQFSSLQGLIPTEANSVTLTNNDFISTLSLPLTSVKGPIIVRGNTMSFSLSMPKLKKAGNIELNNCTVINVPSLESADSGISIVGNNIKSLSLPKMTTTASFTVEDNDFMKTLSVPQLQNVTGAFNVENNTALTGELDFPKVSMISGGPNIIGDFSGLKMPNLERVQGTMFISSTKDIQSDCNSFESMASSVIAAVTCHSATGKSPSKNGGGNSGSSSNSGGSNSGSGSSGGGSGAAGQHSASMILILTAFAGVSAFFAILC